MVPVVKHERLNSVTLLRERSATRPARHENDGRNAEDLRKQIGDHGAARAKQIADRAVRRVIETRIARRPRRERKPEQND